MGEEGFSVAAFIMLVLVRPGRQRRGRQGDWGGEQTARRGQQKRRVGGKTKIIIIIVGKVLRNGLLG